MTTAVLDIEAIPDPTVPFTPKEEARDPFPPAPCWEIVCIGALVVKNHEAVLSCLGEGDERSALRAFASMLYADAPTIVTWNGRRYDLPVIIARCMRHGIPLAPYYSRRDYRYRFSDEGHLDLADAISDHGSGRYFSLDTACKLIRRPGKGDVSGDQVEALWNAGHHDQVREYCLDDVVKTAYVWLRYRHLKGEKTEHLKPLADTIAAAHTARVDASDQFKRLRELEHEAEKQNEEIVALASEIFRNDDLENHP